MIANGYPLLYSDSGTYLTSGHTLTVPVDRPIIYGLFVRHISLSWSVFLVVIAQSGLLVFLIKRLWEEIIGRDQYLAVRIFVVCALMALLTGLDFFISIIIPDIFTSAIVLSFFLLLFGSLRNKLVAVFTALLFAFSLTVHLSHLPLVLGIMVMVGLYHLISKQFYAYAKRYVLITALVILSLFSLSLINYSLDYGFQLSRTKNIFLAARLIKGGIANDFLKEKCGQRKSLPYGELCDYIDQFDQWPTTGHFLFVRSSPLYDDDCIKAGKWDNCWVEKDEAYGQLVSDLLSHPKYCSQYVKLALSGTLEQLVDFGHTHFDKSELDRIISRSYRDDWDFFYASMQDRAGVAFNMQTLIERWVVIISMVILCYFMFFRRAVLKTKGGYLLMIIALALLLNAFICSAFSNVVDRYQGRLIFLIPLVVFLLIEKSRQDKD